MNANASSWRHRPFQDGVPIPYSLSLSGEEFECVRAGLVPQSMMDDKWFIYYEAPFLYFHRSLTGDPVYRLKFAVRHDGASVEEALLATEIAEISEESEEYDARFVDALISALLLDQDKPFPLPWEMRKPWWRRWLVVVRRWWRSRRSWGRRMDQERDSMNLHEACYQGRLDVVARLLANGADPNAPADPSTREWITCAGNRPKPLNCVAVASTVTENHVAIARLLIAHGAVVDDSVLHDHTIEMEGHTIDLALRSIVETAHSR